MSVETPDFAPRVEMSAAAPNANLKSFAGIWPVGVCVLFCWAIFLWASGRGYEFSDEAFDLVTISDPNSAKGLTNFGDVWHPLYLILNGDIAWLRIVGTLLLGMSGALFGLAMSRFIQRVATPSERLTTVLGISVCIFWQHQTWDLPTPDYNMLNLCALLLFFSGLLESGSLKRHAKNWASILSAIIGPVALCVVGLTIMALTKATTAVSAAILGVLWVIVLRPNRLISSLVLTAGLTVALVIFAAILIDGSIFAFVAIKLHVLNLITPPGGGGDVHGIARSVFGIFFKQWWKIAQAGLFAGIIVFLGAAWSYMATGGSQAFQRRGVVHLIAVAIAIVVLWWRVEDLRTAQSFMGFRIWRLLLALLLLTLGTRIISLTRFPNDEQRRKALYAAAILALTPAIYSLGTDNLLIWHMAGAGIFWAAAMMALTSLLPPLRQDRARRATAFLCAATSVALLLGVVIAPGRIGLPLWDQTTSVPIGPRASRIAVTPAAAAYIGTFRQAASENGFTIDTPVVDLSEMGVGLTFALGGKPLGSPVWLISDGWLQDETERRNTVVVLAANAPRLLADVPISQLCRAWVITGAPTYLQIVQTVLTAYGINFPEGYRMVARASRSDLGWTQILWMPLPEAERKNPACGPR